VTWAEALSGCREVGYDLLALDDADEEAWTTAIARSILDYPWWNGFSDAEEEGVWQWSSGAPVSYTHWAYGEPNDAGGEDCAMFVWGGDQWNDGPCDGLLPFVCEVP
jgi:hypothetical protein